MHFVALDLILADGLESPRAHVQRHEGAAHPARFERGEHVGIEVQARRGRGDGSGLARIDGLISLPIRRFGRPFDIGRQRHLAERLEEREYLVRKFQAEQITLAIEQPRRAAAGQKHGRPGLQGLARSGVNQRSARAQHTLEQNLDLSAAILRASDPRGHDTGVVEHQKISRAQKPRKIAEPKIAPCPARSVERQHPAAAARSGRPLRNEFRGKLEVKILTPHPRQYYQAPQPSKARQPPPSNLPRQLPPENGTIIEYTARPGMPGWRNW